MSWAASQTLLLLLLSLILAYKVGATDLEFLSEPSSRLVKLSDGRVVFRCEVSPSSSDVRWLWKGQPVLPSRWIRMSKHKLTVHLNKMDHPTAEESEKGGFQCEARWKSKVLVSAPAELIIAVLQPFPAHKDVHVTAVKGATAVIPCQPPHSVPTVVTEFLFNNVTNIERSTGRYLLMPSGNLQILDVQSSDSGEYVCVANNPFLTEKCQAQHSVFLHVAESPKQEPPRFVVAPPPKTIAVLGSNITLECATTGYPIPSISWKKQHGHLPQAKHQPLAGNMLLFGVHRDDEGTYFCEAENSSGGKISKSTVLEVHETPQIIKAPRDAFVEAGKDVTLQCTSRGHPKPIVTWLHNGKTIAIGGEKKSKDFDLALRNVSQQDSGIYQCFASNELGSTYATSIVFVSHGNRSYDADYDNEDYDDYDDEDGVMNSEKFHHWKGDGPRGKHHSRHNTHDDSDGSSRGDGGRKKHRNKKKHKGVKLVPPSRPEVTRLSDSSVMVRWGVPRNDGLPILFFKVQYRDVSQKGTDWMTVDEDIAAHIHSYAVTDLNNGGKYRFRIAAVYSNNDNKLGPNSAKFVLFKDPPTSKPVIGPVITLTEAVSPSAIALYWDYTDLDSVPIEGFFIYYRSTHSAGDYLKVTVLGANTRSHIISHLLPDTSYDIKMQCFNIAGTSEFSNIFACKTKPSEYIGVKSRNSKSHYSDDEVPSVSVTEPVSSKDSEGNTILNIVLGIISSAMVIALTVFLVLYLRQKSNRQQQSDNDSGRETPIKMGNGHMTNGYVPVNSINISVNPLSDLDLENQGKTTQNGGVVSNNNEIIQLQTFTGTESPPLEPSLEGEKETVAGENEEQPTVIMPSNSETTSSVPRSI